MILETFEAKGLIIIKGHSKDFLKKLYLEIVVFKFRNKKSSSRAVSRISLLSTMIKVRRRFSKQNYNT